MVIPLSLFFVGCGELGRVLETCYESCSCRFIYFVDVLDTTWIHFYEMLLVDWFYI